MSTTGESTPVPPIPSKTSSRRGFLAGLSALIAAPAIVRAASLMPVRGIVMAIGGVDLTTFPRDLYLCLPCGFTIMQVRTPAELYGALLEGFR